MAWWSPSEFSGSSGGVSARNVCACADVRSAESDEAETRNHSTTACGMGHGPGATRPCARQRRQTYALPACLITQRRAHGHRATDAPKAAANHASRSHQRPNAPRTARAEGTVNDGSRRAASRRWVAARSPSAAGGVAAPRSCVGQTCSLQTCNAAARPTLRLCTSVRFGWRSPSRCHLTSSSPQARRLNAFGEHDARHGTNKGPRPKGFGK